MRVFLRSLGEQKSPKTLARELDLSLLALTYKINGPGLPN